MRNGPITQSDHRADTLGEIRIPCCIDEAIQRELFQCYCRGASPETLGRRYGLDVAGVRRLLARLRFRRIKALPLNHVPNDEFQRVTATRERAILAPAPAAAESPKRPWSAEGLPAYLAGFYEAPLLSREQEVHLFRKMNYLKYKASKLVARLDPERPDNGLLVQIEELYQHSIEVKNEIIRANLRLVVAMTKRYAHSTDPLFELVSDGNISLIRAVEKFDYARGFRFSTYATRAIMRNFTQTTSREHRYHARFRNAGERMFEMAPDQPTNQQAEETAQIQRQDEIAQLLEQLDDREKQIICYRYGLDPGRDPMTFDEVGSAMGVTRERARLLANRAIAKLREAAVEERVDASEDRPTSERLPVTHCARNSLRR